MFLDQRNTICFANPANKACQLTKKSPTRTKKTKSAKYKMFPSIQINLRLPSDSKTKY